MLSFEEFQSGEPVVIGILAGDCGSKEPNEETVFHSNILYVDADIAIQCLNHMVELNMSETEGDDFLALMDRIVSKQTGKVFPMPSYAFKDIE